MNDASDESVPVPGSATTGRLEFVGGADIVTIRADASTGDLYRASFQGVAPDVQVEGGSVRVGYPWTFNPLDRRKCSADFALNTAVPWELEVRGGLSRLDADLSGIRLRSLEIGGGSSDVDLTLPEPVAPSRSASGAGPTT